MDKEVTTSTRAEAKETTATVDEGSLTSAHTKTLFREIWNHIVQDLDNEAMLQIFFHRGLGAVGC